ncbi:MAG: PAS domain S-box protein [Nitrospirae bacterium]|nr:PAS domain S-box protein [Nitrospirota bacterium]
MADTQKSDTNSNQPLCNGEDLTERKQLEKKLQESEGKYRTLVETADDAIIVTDLQGRHLFANSAYYASLGYAVGDDPNPDGFSNLHPDDAVMMKNRMSELINTGKLLSEYRVRHKDGGWRYRSTRSTLIRDDEGSPNRLLAICRDVTERKETEILLQQQRSQLEEAQRISHVGSWERDISTNVISLSDEMKRIFGINPREKKFTFQMLLDMMHPDDREPFQKAVREAVFGKKPYSTEYRIVHGDGSTRFIHARGEAQYDGLGKPVIFRGIAQDITERKQAEGALRESRKFLETVIEAAPT